MTHWRQKPKRTRSRSLAEVLTGRDQRRTEALALCVNEMRSSQGPGTLTHAIVAERAGVPVQFVQWKYPSVENLLALADTSRPGGTC